MAKNIYRYYSAVKHEQIQDEIENDIDFAVCILDELIDKFPFLHFQLHVHIDEEEAKDFMMQACSYTTNIPYQD